MMTNIHLANQQIHECSHCARMLTAGNIRKHEKSCKSNPVNQKKCPVCGTVHAKGGVTCSYSCSNTYFRSGKNNPNWKDETYRTTCWAHHPKKCIICGEEKIVAVHHYNENHDDNRPENLIPMCPTHHQYMHSRYSEELRPQVDAYVKNFSVW